MRFIGRSVSSGRARGRALVSPEAISFVGGVDPSTGRIVDPRSPLHGKRLRGRILAFPHGKGSTVGSYVLYGLAVRDRAPSAIAASKAEAIVAVGSILGGIPMVDRIPVHVLRTGDEVRVDGSRGTLDLPGVRERPVVSSFLRNRGRILLVRRSPKVGSFPGHWSAISGYVEGSESTLRRARQEIREETGIREAVLAHRSGVVYGRHADTVYAVHPFLFDVSTRRITLDWENVEARWIRPAEIPTLRTVPQLEEAYASASAADS